MTAKRHTPEPAPVVEAPPAVVSTTGATPDAASAFHPDPAPDPEPEPVIEIPTVEVIEQPEQAPKQAPPEPVRKYKAPRSEPVRAGGYVLGETGWELDPAIAAATAETADPGTDEEKK